MSHDLNLNVLNLYDGQDAAVDLPDLTLSRQSGGNVKGSIVWDAPTKTLEFIASGGVLPADVYTVTLYSRADGFTSTTGLLDGNADNSAGGDYSNQFTITPSTARTLSLADFTRGPDQPVNLPATTSGMTMQLSDGTDVRSVDFVLRYDPNLLNINAINLASGMPAGWSVQSNLSSPGQAIISIFGTTALPAGARSLLKITASVPSDASYGASHAIRVENLLLNEGEITAKGDTALHQVAYVGDATGNRSYSGLDASLAARVAVSLDSGFDAYRNTDPAIVADVTGDKSVSSLDAAYIAAKAAELDQPQIPDLPATGPLPSSPLPSGLPRSITIGSGNTDPGQSIDIPVTIDSGEDVQAFDFIINYDTNKLDIDNLSVSLGSLLPQGWGYSHNVNDANGRIIVSAYNTQSLTPGGGALLNLHFTASANGSASLNLTGTLNEGLIDMSVTPGQVQIGATQFPGDANNDGKVNTLDFNILAHHFGGTGKVFSEGDFNNDTMVDSIDFGIFLANYGRTQAATAPLSLFAEQVLMEDEEAR